MQPQLNDSYYGPAIPPTGGQSRKRNHRGENGCGCLFSILWKLLLALVVLFGLTILIFYLIVQPRPFKFYVAKAELNQFDYVNNTLHYNMVLNFTAHNPNKKLSIYYDKVEAQASYEGSRFANVDVITHMKSFRQNKKSSNPMSGVFSGHKLLVLNNDQISKFNKDKNVGIYDIYVKLYFRIRFKLGDSITRTYKPKVKCDLTVPLRTGYETNFTFIRLIPTKCSVEF
ncbi:late embryogenesis abundant protein [Trifolium pratense]|uniref:Late embryogenesis abundant protein n=1 Tax=Trifolium pratense TaxID=57577 RepID=A0A2K3M9M5_TRIPR|nr:late embryogenesis abundant protein [Trifolium pratense]